MHKQGWAQSYKLICLIKAEYQLSIWNNYYLFQGQPTQQTSSFLRKENFLGKCTRAFLFLLWLFFYLILWTKLIEHYTSKSYSFAALTFISLSTYLDFDLDREWDSECLDALDGLRDPDLLSDFTRAGLPAGDFDWERDS